ncbi:MAG TPA: MmcQ/YjbR family DNA-binding protein [Candidatus Acidoferrales bacterium]|nr:MmcQ/YjbR family DNA-binding protein [Candidatus Acidoferrales bacterium]
MAHPHMHYDPNGPIKRLREICLALPGATEKEAWGECTFRAGGKMFAMTDNNHHDSGHVAVWVKSPAMVQEILVHSDPKRFFVPPYVGHNGWVGVRLDVKVDWEQLAGILADGHRMTAEKARSATPRASRKRAASRTRKRSDRI